jgi:hypothetical protein
MQRSSPSSTVTTSHRLVDPSAAMIMACKRWEKVGQKHDTASYCFVVHYGEGVFELVKMRLMLTAWEYNNVEFATRANIKSLCSNYPT